MSTKTLLTFVVLFLTIQFCVAQEIPEVPKKSVIANPVKPYFVLQSGEKSVGIDQDDSTFDINVINPEGIKEIQVFKDKTAIDKYGEKGVNGVVLIVFNDSYLLPKDIQERLDKAK